MCHFSHQTIPRAAIGLGLAWTLAVAPASAAPPAQQGEPAEAWAALRGSTGNDVGTATFWEDNAGVHIRVEATALPPGEHGLHIHAVGRCEAPDFESAGGHFNPSQREHGSENPHGMHAGDLSNLMVAPDGTANYTTVDDQITLGLGNPATSIFDADGSALVVHANADDYRTDPSGNSGGRIACGVITSMVVAR